MAGNLRQNALVNDALGSALHSEGEGLKAIPGLLIQVVDNNTWQHFVTKLGKEVNHEHFLEFVESPPLDGLGSTEKQLKRACVDNSKALNAIDRALQNPVGVNQHSEGVDNVHTHKPDGNSNAAALRRLRKDAPELHAEVLAGNLSAHAAMVKAGFRPRTVTIRIDDPESIARTLRKYMILELRTELVKLLNELRQN